MYVHASSVGACARLCVFARFDSYSFDVSAAHALFSYLLFFLADIPKPVIMKNLKNTILKWLNKGGTKKRVPVREDIRQRHSRTRTHTQTHTHTHTYTHTYTHIHTHTHTHTHAHALMHN